MFQHSPSGSTPPPASSLPPRLLSVFLFLASLQMVKHTNTHSSTSLHHCPFPSVQLRNLLYYTFSLAPFPRLPFVQWPLHLLLIYPSNNDMQLNTHSRPHADTHCTHLISQSDAESTRCRHVNHSQLYRWAAFCRSQLSDDKSCLVALSEHTDTREH